MGKLIDFVLAILVLMTVVILVVYVGVWVTEEISKEFNLKDGMISFTGKTMVLMWYFILMTSVIYSFKSKNKE